MTALLIRIETHEVQYALLGGFALRLWGVGYRSNHEPERLELLLQNDMRL